MSENKNNSVSLEHAEYDELVVLARANPTDRDILKFFFEEHEQVQPSDTDAQIAYHHLQYLLLQRRLRYERIEDTRSKHLKDLIDLYLEKDDRIVASFCANESLRLNPDQPDVYEKVKSLAEYAKPKFPNTLREDTCKVSVLTTTNRASEELKASIQSVLNQTYQDYELIVANDGGPQSIGDLVRSFHSDRIRYIERKENKGTFYSHNEMIEQANGKYIAYLDDDDVMYPNHLEIMVDVLEEKKARFGYAATKGVSGNLHDGVFEPKETIFLWDKDYCKQTLTSEIYMGNFSIVHEKSLFADAGLFLMMRFSGDWEMWLRMAQVCDFVHVPHVAGEYRYKLDNVSVKKRDQAYFGGRMVTSHHLYFQGRIGLLKYYLHAGEKNKAVELYDSIKSDYEKGFQTEELLLELIGIAQRMKDTWFEVQLSRDLFRWWPRRGMKKMMADRSWPMFMGGVSQLPSSVYAKMKNGNR